MNQGTYELTITLKRNYSSVSGHTANWYIEPREVTLDWRNTENRTFGDDKTVTATAGNLVNGDTITVAVAGGDETAAGSHTATATGLTGDKAENYKLPTAVTKEYIIGKAAAKVITPPTAASLFTTGFRSALLPSAARLPAVRWSTAMRKMANILRQRTSVESTRVNMSSGIRCRATATTATRLRSS